MEPREYQTKAVDFLSSIPHSICADDMGVGKTPEAIWAVEKICKEDGKSPSDVNVLVICPNSVKSVWLRHFAELTIIPITVVNNKKREWSWDNFKSKLGGVFITHYEAAWRMPQLTNRKEVKWDFLICDEAHRLSNRKTKQWKYIKRIKAERKFALTGTPLDGRPDKLWGILHWLYPKQFPGYWKFYEAFCEYELEEGYNGTYKKFKGPKNVEFLRDRVLKPIMIRREKQQVLPELPDKFTENVYLDMTDKQYDAHESMEEDMMAWLAGQSGEELLAAPVVIAQLTRMRQFATSYCTIVGNNEARMAEPSNKLDALMDTIQDNPKKFVVFSQFRQMVDLAIKRFEKEGITHRKLVGGMIQLHRDRAIDEFQNDPDVQVFIATIQTGGEGITLTAADTVIFLDRSWSPKDNTQAEDRLHRFGQENAVQVINYLSTDSVDEYVDATIELKKGWIKQVIGSSND